MADSRWARRVLLRLCAGVALVFAPVAEAAPPTGIHTIQDLFDVCADSSAESKAACDAYVHATIQTAEIMRAADNDGKLTPLFCPSDSMTSQDLIAILRLQVASNPERKTFPAPTVIIGGGIEAYPCQKTVAQPATPAHKTPPRKRRR